MKDMLNNRWIVIRMDGGDLHASTRPVMHKDPESAKAEAKRLAGLHPGSTFIVFQAVGAAMKPDPVVWVQSWPFSEALF